MYVSCIIVVFIQIVQTVKNVPKMFISVCIGLFWREPVAANDHSTKYHFEANLESRNVEKCGTKSD